MFDFFDLKSQYHLIKDDINFDIGSFLDKQNFILGNENNLLEKKLSEIVKSKYVIGCANGTDAITIALLSLNLEKNSEILIPAFNYISSVESCVLLGLKPVFVDIRDDFLIDCSDLEKKITEKSKVIIPTSLFGRCCDFKSLKHISKKYKLKLIEDAAQSFGAKDPFGNFSCSSLDISCTSFFPTKPLGCYGDGGAIFTNNKSYHDIIKMITRHGQIKTFDHKVIGMNSRLDTLQSFFLLKKIKIFKKELKLRLKNYKKLCDIFTKYPEIKINHLLKNEVSSCAIFAFIFEKRFKLSTHLRKYGIPSRIYYPKPVYAHKPYKKFMTNCPMSEYISKNVISIPIGPYLTDDYFSILSKSLDDFFN